MTDSKSKSEANQKRELILNVDYYYDGEYVVFTEKYLRDRGYCCENGCRHCPYIDKQES